jgi:hypothetical protein
MADPVLRWRSPDDSRHPNRHTGFVLHPERLASPLI